MDYSMCSLCIIDATARPCARRQQIFVAVFRDISHKVVRFEHIPRPPLSLVNDVDFTLSMSLPKIKPNTLRVRKTSGLGAPHQQKFVNRDANEKDFPIRKFIGSPGDTLAGVVCAALYCEKVEEIN
jgi:hypothetical protein